MCIPKWSSDIWQTLSNELENKWDRHAVRTNVNGNRRNILTIASKECGYYRDESTTKSDVYGDEIESIDSSSNSDDEGDNDNDPDYCKHVGYFEDFSKIEEFDVEICR